MRKNKFGMKERVYVRGALMRDIPFYYNRVSGKCTWGSPRTGCLRTKAFERREKCGSGFTEEEPDGHPAADDVGGAADAASRGRRWTAPRS